MVTQNQGPGQKPIQTMVRSMATQNHQHFPETMLPHIQDQEVNNNNINTNNSSKKVKVADQNKSRSRKRIPLASPFLFHYTFEAPDYHNLDLELRATCGRYNTIKLRSQQFSRPVKVVELDQSNNKAVRNRTNRSNIHQETLPNQITEEQNISQLPKLHYPEKTVRPGKQQRRAGHQKPKMSGRVSLERSERLLQSRQTHPTSFERELQEQHLGQSRPTKPDDQRRSSGGESKYQQYVKRNFQERDQPTYFDDRLQMPNQTNWEEDGVDISHDHHHIDQDRGPDHLFGAKPPRRLPTISEEPKSKLPRLDYTTLRGQNCQNSLYSENSPKSLRKIDPPTKIPPKQEQVKESRNGRDENLETRRSKVEMWRKMFLERHSQRSRGHKIGLNQSQSHPHQTKDTLPKPVPQGAHHPHAPHEPQDGYHITPSRPLNPTPFNPGYDERRKRRSPGVRVRFKEGGYGRNRMVGFSRGLQDGLRKGIKRMVRSRHNDDANHQSCLEKGICDKENNCVEATSEGNLELGSKPRSAWPTPRHKGKVTVQC